MSRTGRMVRAGQSESWRENGFTIIELAVVIITIAVILSISILIYYNTVKKTDARAGLEVIKQEIRSIHALTDSGEMNASGYKYAYGIQVHNFAEDPPNCFRIIRGSTADGSNYTWTVFTPEERTRYKTLAGGWIILSSSSGVDITYTDLVANLNTGDGNNNGIALKAEGSMVVKFNAEDSTITVTGGGPDNTVTVSEYVSVSD